MNNKPKIIGIFESRLQKKHPICNISLPNYFYEHTPTESGKKGTLLYIDQNQKHKVRGNISMYSKSLIESTLIKIKDTTRKSTIKGYM